MAMTQPFIEGFGGCPITATDNLIKDALARRGIPATQSVLRSMVQDGRTWVKNGYSTGLDLIRIPSGDFAVGARLTVADSSNRDQGLNITIGSRLYTVSLIGGSVGVRDASAGVTTLGSGGHSSVFVEAIITGTTLTVFSNNSGVADISITVVPSAETSVISLSGGSGWTGSFMTDLYVWNSRLGEGTARLLPTSVSVTGGTAGGSASSVADGLASLDVQTKYVTFAPGQQAKLGLAAIVDNPASIRAVSAVVVGRKSGTALLPELVTTTTASQQTVATPVLGIGFSSSRTGIATDPHDSTPWTKAKVNALLVGVGSA